MTLKEVRRLLLKRAAKYRVNNGTTGVHGWCIAHSVAESHVSRFLSGKDTARSDMLDALGLEWRIVRKRR